jgi:uncharacterized membrane protein
MSIATMRLLAALLALTTQPPHSSAAQSAPPRFHLVLLESDPYAATTQDAQHAVAINAAGECAGAINRTDGSQEAAFWDATGALTILGRPGLGGGEWLRANDLDDDGTVVGSAFFFPNNIPLLWDLGSGEATALAFPHGTTAMSVDGTGVNAGVLLQTLTATWQQYGTILWRDGTTSNIEIPGGWAAAMNGVRQVAGARTFVGVPLRAFRWTAPPAGGGGPPGGSYDELLPLPGYEWSMAFGIDELGTVVGESRDAATGFGRGTLWTPANVPVPLQLLHPDASGATARAVNANGWVVGYEDLDETAAVAPRGVLWIRGQAFELDDLVVATGGGSGGAGGGTGIHISVAFDVNDAGQIACRAVVDGVGRAARLDPQQLPFTSAD